ncbi:MAG: hypothetical protein QOJ79_2186 [Actinomycetota bacterium]|jgi:hypothetical protein|nr:hypothetical protein [Actinomycetota bacterium]
MALQPVGPLPASTYWRRRVLVLVVVVVGVLVVAKACGSDPKPETLSGAKPSPSPSASPSAQQSPVTTGSPAPPTPAPLQTCRDTVLQVTAESDAESYPSGGAPKFTLTVRNIGSVACRRALGPDAVELRVLSGEDRIWSSDDCNTAKGQGVMTLKPGEAQALSVRWPGKRTKPGCDVGDVAQPGTYRVSARVGDIVRQGSVFRITG